MRRNSWMGAACAALLMLLALPCALGRAENVAVIGERLLEALPILPERSGALTLCEEAPFEPGVLADEALVRDLQAAGRRARIVNAEWVNLRQSTSKSSPALTTVDSTQTVTILRERCGEDEGWTRVLFVDAQGTAWTGYIWWSFLEQL